MYYIFPATRRMTGFNLFSIWSGAIKSAINVVSGIALFVPYVMRVLTLRRLMSYIYGAPILDVSRSHTTAQHSR